MLNPIQARRVRRAVALLCLAWVSVSCSHSAAVTIDEDVAEAVKEVQCLEEHSWALLSGSNSSHEVLTSFASGATRQPLNVLKFFLAAEDHTLCRCQLVQLICARVVDVLTPQHLLVLPGIPPPSALV